MVRKFCAAVAAAAALFAGCAPVETTPITTLRATNTLTNVTVSISGKQVTLDQVDLYGVFVGTTAFSYVPGGASSAQEVTTQSGTLRVTVDSGVGYAGGNEVCVFTNIADTTFQMRTGENIVQLGSWIFATARAAYRTGIQIQNTVTNVTRSIAGTSVRLDEVDVYGVHAGDVSFPTVLGGYSSESENHLQDGYRYHIHRQRRGDRKRNRNVRV